MVWANQREALAAAVGPAGRDKRSLQNHPLVKEGKKLIPSITKVFRKDQRLYVLFEAYDPGRKQGTGSAALAVNMSVFRDGRKVFESDARRIGANLEARSGALPVDLEIPLDQIGAGEYICQLNVMDEAGRKFAFHQVAPDRAAVGAAGRECGVRAGPKKAVEAGASTGYSGLWLGAGAALHGRPPHHARDRPRPRRHGPRTNAQLETAFSMESGGLGVTMKNRYRQ